MIPAFYNLAFGAAFGILTAYASKVLLGCLGISFNKGSFICGAFSLVAVFIFHAIFTWSIRSKPEPKEETNVKES